MFRLKLRLFILLPLIVYSTSAQSEFQLQHGTVVAAVDGDRAKELLMTEDEYTAILSRFDLQSKTQKTDDVTLNDYLKYSAEQVVGWTDNEKKMLGDIVSSTAKKIKDLGLNLKMPEKIEVIKSTMNNEGGAAGYTRGNYIVLKQSNVQNGGYDNLFIHELFHVLSRYDKDMSERVYNTIGFRKTNEIAYPKEIADLRISNPDAPFNNFYITIQHNNKPVDAMLILFANKQYAGGSFFSYLQIGILAVEGDEMTKTPVYTEGKPLILKVKEVQNFYEQIGKNTSYILHAEEVSADHFELLLNRDKDIPNPELIEAMKNVMK
jgi:hypothetical protein